MASTLTNKSRPGIIHDSLGLLSCSLASKSNRKSSSRIVSYCVLAKILFFVRASPSWTCELSQAKPSQAGLITSNHNHHGAQCDDHTLRRFEISLFYTAILLKLLKSTNTTTTTATASATTSRSSNSSIMASIYFISFHRILQSFLQCDCDHLKREGTSESTTTAVKNAA